MIDKKQKDINKVNKDYDTMIENFQDMVTKTEQTMPLVSKSLELTVELIKTYKEAFNAIIKNK